MITFYQSFFFVSKHIFLVNKLLLQIVNNFRFFIPCKFRYLFMFGMEGPLKISTAKGLPYLNI